MLSKEQDQKWESELLKDGTSVGPVTIEMIKYCREMYKGKDYEFWPDGLSLARVACGMHKENNGSVSSKNRA